MRIGIIRERKSPPDNRVPLSPKHCKEILERFPYWSIKVESSPSRCFSDDEYRSEGISVVEDVSDCNVLFGVKEVPIENLIPGKQYFFFSHTIKKQAHNKKLIKSALAKNIHLCDYECLVNDEDRRIIGFGVFAGIVGAHNGLLGFGKKSGTFTLKRAKDAEDYAELRAEYEKTDWPKFRTVITGGGRVASGAQDVLQASGIKQVSPEEYLNETFDEAVWCSARSSDYYRNKKTGKFDRSFYEHPENFDCDFKAYAEKSDLMINGIFYDTKGPAFFNAADMKSDWFRIAVIADVTCDIAPESSIPSTLYASTIADPFFDYNPETGKAEEAFQKANILMMSIDNLPNELPRDASTHFGKVLLDKVIPELDNSESPIIQRATICKNGSLTSFYHYLSDYAS